MPTGTFLTPNIESRFHRRTAPAACPLEPTTGARHYCTPHLASPLLDEFTHFLTSCSLHDLPVPSSHLFSKQVTVLISTIPHGSLLEPWNNPGSTCFLVPPTNAVTSNLYQCSQSLSLGKEHWRCLMEDQVSLSSSQSFRPPLADLSYRSSPRFRSHTTLPPTRPSNGRPLTTSTD